MTDADQDMRVIKRNGDHEVIAFDKILARIRNVGRQAGITAVNYTSLAMKVIDQLYDGIPTTKIDELTAEQCATMATQHPDYGTLAAYIIVSNHHKTTPPTFYEAMRQLHEFTDVRDQPSQRQVAGGDMAADQLGGAHVGRRGVMVVIAPATRVDVDDRRIAVDRMPAERGAGGDKANLGGGMGAPHQDPDRHETVQIRREMADDDRW